MRKSIRRGLIGLAAVGSLLLSGVAPASAHAPIGVAPEFLVLAPGQAGVVTLEIISTAAPGEVAQDTTVAFQPDPHGVPVLRSVPPPATD